MLTYSRKDFGAKFAWQTTVEEAALKNMVCNANLAPKSFHK
jgi:hypothetical protein